MGAPEHAAARLATMGEDLRPQPGESLFHFSDFWLEYESRRPCVSQCRDTSTKKDITWPHARLPDPRGRVETGVVVVSCG